MTPAERKFRAQIGAYSLHAQGKTNTAPARAAFFARFEREVDPEGILPPAERHRRAEFKYKAYMKALSLKSSRSRKKNKKIG